MNKEPEIVEKVAKSTTDVEIEDAIDDLVPRMNVTVPSNPPAEAAPELITDDDILEIYGDILKDINEKEKEVSDYVANMAEMVFNEGDATTSSKEALVNFVKIETDLIDKKVKIADLMTRIKLKETNTFPRYLAAHQNNTININDSGKKRQLLEAINKAKKKKEE